MSSNGTTEAYGPVLSALQTLQSNIDKSQKAKAHEYLESFQKNPEAWSAVVAILTSSDASNEAKLFGATTLKGKITYDLHQLPRDSLPSLRDKLISLLGSFSNGPKPIRIQICVGLANLAIQMTEWKDVLSSLVSTLGSTPQGTAALLEFLRVLPEEVTEGRKINLTEDELNQRTDELLQDNAEQVLKLLMEYRQSSDSAAKDPQLLECITSWLREVPMNDIVNSPLLENIIGGLSQPEAFDSAVECLCAIFRETREVDESLSTIQTLYPRLLSLRPKIAEAAQAEDWETLKGVTRVFSEAGEAWVVLTARLPQDFRALVDAILECAARDADHDAVSQTFNFWFELKQYLVLEKYMEARLQYVDVFSNLVDVMINHLQYPKPESGQETDLFEGDREQEDKFREFRHQMGDVLKDCCEVIGVTECLRKSYQLIEKWVGLHGTQAQAGQVPDWQALEAPLFSMRAMGRMVSPDENSMLPRLMPLIIQIPDQEKVRFQAVMALGRYTEWTAQHPETLQPQLDFIMAAFNHSSGEVVRAAALSFRFFCTDCAELLKDYTSQLQGFYESVIDKLSSASQDEITEGVAAVLARQPADKTYSAFKQACDPVVNKLMEMSSSATDEKSKLAIADKLQLVTIFVQWIQPYVDPGQPNPAVQYCQEIFPILARIAEVFQNFVPILERVCRCWRYMVLSYRTAMTPLLPQLAEKLAAGFEASRQGCFLWATDSIVREFSEGAENAGQNITDSVFVFFEQQATTFLRVLHDLPPEELPDLIEDFFRLCLDVLMYYPHKLLASSLINPILNASTSSLSLLKEEPLLAILHFHRDFLAYGGEDMPTSRFDDAAGYRTGNPPEVQATVKKLLAEHGESLTQRVMIGMMYSFPRECFPDASGVILALFQIVPKETIGWIQTVLSQLPQGSLTTQESQRLISNLNKCVQESEMRKIRGTLQDFTNSYRRRNVAPREGLGRLEAARFRFNK